jgi:hypothetical protein
VSRPVVFGALAGMAAAVLWWPLARIPAHYQINYNEGWNSYLQNKGAVYRAPPEYVYANYPPVSFHLVGLFGHEPFAGRWISAASFLAIALFVGLIVRRLAGAAWCGVYAALAFAIFLGVFEPEYIGMNDPHLLAMAIGMAAVYLLLRGNLTASAALFALSLFTKQSLLAVPLAAAVYLWRTSRRDLARWMGAAAAVSVALAALIFAMDGPYFLKHLAFPREYSFANIWEVAGWGAYLVLFQVAIAAAVWWSLDRAGKGTDGLLVWSFALTHTFALWFGTGGGVNRNILFEPIVWLAILLGMAAPYAKRHAAVLLLLPFLGPWAWLIGGRIHQDQAEAHERAAHEAEYAQVLAAVQARPGDALCETPLVCFQAGKPQRYDPYMLGQLYVAGRLAEADLNRLVDERRLGAIELELPERGAAVERAGRKRLPEEFLARVREAYELTLRTPDYVVYTPR